MSIEKAQSVERIGVLFRAHYRELCVFGLRFIADMDLVEDVVQNVFLHFLAQKIQIENIQNPRAYLYSAVRNACLKQMKQGPFTVEGETQLENLDGTDDSMEDEMIHVERKIQIYRAIDALPPQCKKIFIRCHLDHLKYLETAEDLEISVNSVKTQMKKAYRLLREALKDVYSLYSFLLMAVFDNISCIF